MSEEGGARSEKAPALTFSEAAPDPRLAPWCARYWGFSVGDGAPPVHHVPPDGATSILIKLGGDQPRMALVSGPWLVPLSVPVHPGDRYVGVRIRTGATEAVLGSNPARLLNQVTPLVDLAGPEAIRFTALFVDCHSLEDATPIFDNYFRRRAGDFPKPDPLVRDAVELLVSGRGETSILLISKKLETSQRTLLRRFKYATGLTPKQYARICRFRFAAISLLGSRPQLSSVAASGGYVDQAHLHHEVLTLTGLTPAALAARVASIRHENMSR